MDSVAPGINTKTRPTIGTMNGTLTAFRRPPSRAAADRWCAHDRADRTVTGVGRTRRPDRVAAAAAAAATAAAAAAVAAGTDPAAAGTVSSGSRRDRRPDAAVDRRHRAPSARRRAAECRRRWRPMRWGWRRVVCRPVCRVCRPERVVNMSQIRFGVEDCLPLTSFVFRLGVDRDELEPDRDGGRCSADGFELLPPGLSPFRPMLSRSRSRTSSGWSPFGRGEGDSCARKQKSRGWEGIGWIGSITGLTQSKSRAHAHNSFTLKQYQTV